MNKEEKGFDLINYDDYKSYYQDTSKEEILHDTWLDYCAYRNIIEKNTELQSQLDIANKKLNKIKELVNKYGYYTLSEIPELLSIIGGNNE